VTDLLDRQMMRTFNAAYPLTTRHGHASTNPQAAIFRLQNRDDPAFVIR
jgi:hypothetical protein